MRMPEDAAGIFTGAGHDVSTPLRQGLGGKGDSEVAAACKAEGRALITLDTDFANVRAYPPQNFEWHSMGTSRTSAPIV